MTGNIFFGLSEGQQVSGTSYWYNDRKEFVLYYKKQDSTVKLILTKIIGKKLKIFINGRYALTWK